MPTLTVLGSGTSTGVPRIHCSCKVCRSRNPKNKRLRPSVWIQSGGVSLLVDTSPDLRTQALREKIRRVDAVLYTHPHYDHIAGIDELRSYNFAQKQSIPVYGNAWTVSELRVRFDYIFRPRKVEGGGIPRLEIRRINKSTKKIRIKGVTVEAVPYRHGSKETLGFRVGNIAYIPDCSYIPPASIKRLKNLKALVLDCAQVKPHGTHLHLGAALELIEELKPRKTFLSHLGHDFDYGTWNQKLPRGVKLAYDGLKIKE